MKKILWMATMLMATAMVMPAQQGRGGAPLAFNDTDKDGICDVTNKPVGQRWANGQSAGQGAGRGMGFRQGRGRGGQMARGRGMGRQGRGMGMQRQVVRPVPETPTESK